MQKWIVKLCVGFCMALPFFSCVHRTSEPDLGPRFASRELLRDGLKRQYLLYTPSAYQAQAPTPLIIGFHGGSTSHARLARTTQFHELAEREGFLVAFPNGVDANWNDGRGTANPHINDVGFIETMITEIKKTHNVDTRRIYVTGISNGAFMVQRLACEKADLFAAFVAVAGSMGKNLHATCKPSRPLPMMIINSPEDRFVEWQGGEMKRGKGGIILSVPELVEFWKNTNGCAAAQDKALPKSRTSDPTRLVMRRHSQCKENSTVVLYKVEGGGHTWPGGKDQPPWLVGPTSEELNATTESWKFFRQYSLPE